MPVGERSPAARTAWGMLFVVLLLYGALRWLLLPGGDPTVTGFSHDSAYLTLVAENVRTGRGYVNDAHWLVFLQPDALPLPYHNANPLMPLLMALVAEHTEGGVVASGFAVCATASVFLLAGVFFLLRRYEVGTGTAVLLALAAVLCTPVFADSLQLAPDTPCSAFAVLCLACVARSRGAVSVVAGGVFFGLAWLTRSSVILLLPALAVYLVAWDGWKQGLVRLTLLGLTAVTVASPWLIHTARVWGSPFRSDAPYYLWQEYHAQAFGDEVERVWHSPQEPPALGELLRREPGAVISFVARGVPRLLKNLVAHWTHGSLALAGLLAALGLLALGKTPLVARSPEQRRDVRPEILALSVYLLTMILGFAPRAGEFEPRYFDIVAIFCALLLAFGPIRAFQERRADGAGRVAYHVLLVTLGSFLWLYVTPLRDLALYRQLAAPSAANEAYFTLVEKVHKQIASRAPVVVGFSPYYYTLLTGTPALSIPEADDTYLQEYMRRYGACHVLLTQQEAAFWRPRWLEADGLPNWLEKTADLDGALLFKRREAP